MHYYYCKIKYDRRNKFIILYHMCICNFLARFCICEKKLLLQYSLHNNIVIIIFHYIILYFTIRINSKMMILYTNENIFLFLLCVFTPIIVLVFVVGFLKYENINKVTV
jgi:hypothetical protein